MKVLITGAGALRAEVLVVSLRSSALRAEETAVGPSPLPAGLYCAERLPRTACQEPFLARGCERSSHGSGLRHC
jgi:hypothetical protein